MENLKEHLFHSIIIAVGALVVARVFGTFLFEWFTGLAEGRKEKQAYEDLDKVIENRKIYFKKQALGAAPDLKVKNEGQKEENKLLDEPEEIKEQKRLIAKILAFPLYKKAGESDEDFYLHILELKGKTDFVQVKKQYRKLAKDWHPDRFDLSDFDAKTKEKLEKRLNQNFQLICQAFEFFKKT